MLEMAKENQHIIREHEKQIEESAYKAKMEADQEIKAIEKEIHTKNQELNNDGVGQRYQITKMKKEIEGLQTKNKNYKRDMMLNAETVEQYSKRQNQQNRKIKLLKSKIQILEKSLSQIVQDFEKEKTLLKYQNDQYIKEQQDDIYNLQEELKVQNRELKSVKGISQTVITQRSDVEQFFLEALEQIKEEIRKKLAEERKAQRYGAGLTRPKNQENEKSGEQESPNKTYADKVDLNDLDWEDRERVLRLLFSKINAGVHPQMNWKQDQSQTHAQIEDVYEDRESEKTLSITNNQANLE